MALIRGCADDGVTPNTCSVLAGVGLRTGVVVVTGSPIGLARVNALPGRRVAGASVVTLIRRRADDRVCTRADTGLAGIGLCTGITVVARSTIRLERIGADSSLSVADADVMAGIESSTDDRIRPDAHTCLAGVGLGTGVAVIAGGPIRLIWG